MRKFFLSLAAVFSAMFLMTSCDSNSSDATPEESKPSITAKTEVVAMPAALTSSTNQYAKQVKDLVTAATDINDYFNYFEVPDNAVASSKKSANGGSKTYTWTESDEDHGSVTVKWTYTEGTTENTWVIDVNWVANGKNGGYKLTATEKTDKSAGTLKAELKTDAVTATLANYEWSTDTNGVFKFKASFIGGYSYIVNVNADKSGNIEVKNPSGVKVYYAVWDAKGSGSITVYGDGASVNYKWTV